MIITMHLYEFTTSLNRINIYDSDVTLLIRKPVSLTQVVYRSGAQDESWIDVLSCAHYPYAIFSAYNYLI